MLDIESGQGTRPGRIQTRSDASLCAGCGRPFTAVRPHQRFCDVSCRRLSWRAGQEATGAARDSRDPDVEGASDQRSGRSRADLACEDAPGATRSTRPGQHPQRGLLLVAPQRAE